jgi:hypothetical protein
MSSVGVCTPRLVKCHSPNPGALTLKSLPLVVSTVEELSPGVVQTVQLLEWPLIFTVGPSPVGDRLQVPSTLAATWRFTASRFTYQRVPSP